MKQCSFEILTIQTDESRKLTVEQTQIWDMFIDAAPTHETYKTSDKKNLKFVLPFYRNNTQSWKNRAKYNQSYLKNTKQELERGHEAQSNTRSGRHLHSCRMEQTYHENDF